MPGPTQLSWDGFTTQEAGMNDGVARQRLNPTQAALLVNATTRGDFIKQRPGFRRVMTILSNPPGFYQHGSWFRTVSGEIYVLVVCAGRFYRVDPIHKTVKEVTIPGDPNPSTMMRGWSIQAENWWLYNDGQSPVFIYDGGDARRAKENEIRPGTVITYTQGRIWYALPDGLTFRAADLVGNPDSGTAAFGFKDSVLRETENSYLAEGGDFAVPTDHGEITAMRSIAILDVSQGQGPLQVLCERNGFSVNTPVDRTAWKSLNYPIQTVSMVGAGCAGQQSTVNVNGDLFFRDSDSKGIRSYIVARRLFRDWGNTPQSFEVSGLLDLDQPDLLTFASGAVLDDRLLMTCSPVYSTGGIYHRGLIALDLSPITSIQATAPPCYDGLWTGLRILTLIRTTNALYMTVIEDDSTIALWEVTLDDKYDDDDGRIKWTVIPRQFFVERDPAGRPSRTLKRLETAELEYDNLLGTVDFTMFWSPDAYPCWSEWAKWQECVTSCEELPACEPGTLLKSGYQARKRLPTPPGICMPGAKRPLANFYTLGARFDVEGPARILGVRFGATLHLEPPYEANTCATPDCVSISCCDFDYFTYTSQGSSGDHYPYAVTTPITPAPPVDESAGAPPGDPDLDQLEGGEPGGNQEGGGGGGGGGGVPGGPFGIPTVNGWTVNYTGAFVSGYGFPRTTNDIAADGMTQAQADFWKQLLVNEFNSTPQEGYTEVTFAWDWVDDYFGYYGDFVSKYATGNTSPFAADDPPTIEMRSFWRLILIYR